MTVIAPDYQTERRMALKRQAIPLPAFSGKRVLDVGTDHGYWAFLAAEQGAQFVLGLDRNREVRGRGFANLIAQNTAIAKAKKQYNACSFERINLGKEWRGFGKFDVVLVMSVYHHIFNNCGDHNAVWFWLAQHCNVGAELIWEGPLDDVDSVVKANVSDGNRKSYTRDNILTAAARYFEGEFVGPALHEPTREVWRFRPRPQRERLTWGKMVDGAGGATAAFEYADGRRMDEIEEAMGWRPVPGSLNLAVDGPFNWDDGYYRAQVLDVIERGKGLDVNWSPRWARFYPLTIDGVAACGFRFEGEGYRRNFLELIAPVKLRDAVKGPLVTIAR